MPIGAPPPGLAFHLYVDAPRNVRIDMAGPLRHAASCLISDINGVLSAAGLEVKTIGRPTTVGDDRGPTGTKIKGWLFDTAKSPAPEAYAGALVPASAVYPLSVSPQGATYAGPLEGDRAARLGCDGVRISWVFPTATAALVRTEAGPCFRIGGMLDGDASGKPSAAKVRHSQRDQQRRLNRLADPTVRAAALRSLTGGDGQFAERDVCPSFLTRIAQPPDRGGATHEQVQSWLSSLSLHPVVVSAACNNARCQMRVCQWVVQAAGEQGLARQQARVQMSVGDADPKAAERPAKMPRIPPGSARPHSPGNARPLLPPRTDPSPTPGRVITQMRPPPQPPGPVRFSASSPSAGLALQAAALGIQPYGSMAGADPAPAAAPGPTTAMDTGLPRFSGWNAADGEAGELPDHLEPALATLAEDFDGLVKSGNATVFVQQVETLMKEKGFNVETTRAVTTPLVEAGVLSVVAVSRTGEGPKLPAFKVLAPPELG